MCKRSAATARVNGISCRFAAPEHAHYTFRQCARVPPLSPLCCRNARQTWKMQDANFMSASAGFNAQPHFQRRSCAIGRSVVFFFGRFLREPARSHTKTRESATSERSMGREISGRRTRAEQATVLSATVMRDRSLGGFRHVSHQGTQTATRHAGIRDIRKVGITRNFMSRHASGTRNRTFGDGRARPVARSVSPLFHQATRACATRRHPRHQKDRYAVKFPVPYACGTRNRTFGDGHARPVARSVSPLFAPRPTTARDTLGSATSEKSRSNAISCPRTPAEHATALLATVMRLCRTVATFVPDVRAARADVKCKT